MARFNLLVVAALSVLAHNTSARPRLEPRSTGLPPLGPEATKIVADSLKAATVRSVHLDQMRADYLAQINDVDNGKNSKARLSSNAADWILKDLVRVADSTPTQHYEVTPAELDAIYAGGFAPDSYTGYSQAFLASDVHAKVLSKGLGDSLKNQTQDLWHAWRNAYFALNYGLYSPEGANKWKSSVDTITDALSSVVRLYST
ncbi:hypothetical protein IE81DRAFT_350677 [Ceraceosorus guamensis]|uniref:Uncharacterized protein n=1 Tax=Ceraceosorus guamensis TaxID=1522189 RepID=A0A316VRR0_9BASI|nr:hypothetical protein IE81DRAFT_350677 [Ceraceosorus guamensis]PWN38871.1 hypothetical protein IE81DRAFT_350677 [Ceraceosorus guamensis]